MCFWEGAAGLKTAVSNRRFDLRYISEFFIKHFFLQKKTSSEISKISIYSTFRQHSNLMNYRQVLIHPTFSEQSCNHKKITRWYRSNQISGSKLPFSNRLPPPQKKKTKTRHLMSKISDLMTCTMRPKY